MSRIHLLSDWLDLAQHDTHVVVLETYLCDQTYLLEQYWQWGQFLGLPIYLWNPGCTALHQVEFNNGRVQTVRTELAEDVPDLMQFLLDNPQMTGIFLLEGALQFDGNGNLNEKQHYQLAHAVRQLDYQIGTPHSSRQYWVILSEPVELPVSLQPLVPTLSQPLPNRFELTVWLSRFLPSVAFPTPDADQERMIRACQGLPIGEVDRVARRLLSGCNSLGNLAEAIVEYKITKLSGRGLEFIAAPDVPGAGGLEKLSERLDLISALFHPAAREQYGLRFPKGMILWGPPGTGKSLSAKLAAKKIGVPLLAADWNGISTDADLRFLLATAEAMAPCILYLDDFEKSTSLNADDGGASKRRIGKLLTWMQEHTSQVLTMATVNRLGMMPPELIRRFEEEIWFVDLPHDGARYEIFALHLGKYFPAFKPAEGQPFQPLEASPWTPRQWGRLLRDFRLCTPAEIANAVRRVAQECFYDYHRAGTIGEPLQVSYDRMLNERERFTPALARGEEADNIIEIRNKAVFAKPASGEDKSVFMRGTAELGDAPPAELVG